MTPRIFAQAEGQGIQTIRSTMKAVVCPPPRFNATEVSVTGVLRAHLRFRAVSVPTTRGPEPRVQAKQQGPGVQKKAGEKSTPAKEGKRG